MASATTVALAAKKAEELDIAFLESEVPQTADKDGKITTHTGLENLDDEDYSRPKMLLCQSNTPQRKKTSDVFIQNLEEGQFFNLITGQIYGPELEVIPVFVGAPYANEYDKDGKVVDFNIALDDPRLVGSKDENGEYHTAKAKRQLDYTMLLPGFDLQPVVWTAKGAGRGVAKQMNIALSQPLVVGGKKWKEPPMFARAFIFKSGPSRGSHENYVVNMSIPRLVSKIEFNKAKLLFTELKKVSDERKAGDDIPF